MEQSAHLDKPPAKKYWVRIPGAEWEVSEPLFAMYLEFGYTVHAEGLEHVAEVAPGYTVSVSHETGDLVFEEQVPREVKNLSKIRSNWARLVEAAVLSKRKIPGGVYR